MTVLRQHGGVIHAVDVIASKNQGEFGAAALKQVEVLVDGIRSSRVPRGAGPHLWRNWRDVFAQFRIVDRPSVPQMLLERMRLVLRQDEDLSKTGVKTVAQREVDDAVATAERDSGFR